MEVELPPVLVTKLTRLRVLELVEIQWPHLYVWWYMLGLRHGLLVAHAGRLELPHSRRHLRGLRDLMPVVLLARIDLTSKMVGSLWRVAHPLLRTPAVVPSASLLHLLDLRDVVLSRFDATCLRRSFCSFCVSCCVERRRIVLSELALSAQLLRLLRLNEILAHEVSLILHLQLPMVESVTVRIDWHVLESSRGLDIVELPTAVAIRPLPVRVQLEVQLQVLVDVVLEAEARRWQLILELGLLLQALKFLELEGQLAAT